jgi:hypothetical protein
MKKKSVYDSVPNEKRVKLIQMVNNGDKLNKSAALLNINYSTAKTILRIYRNERRIFKKVPVKSFPIKKKVFSIERANCSTQTSHEDNKHDSKDSKFKSPKSAFKKVEKCESFPFKLEDVNFYLNMRLSILAEISRNQQVLNFLGNLMCNFPKLGSN